ncbi:MAG: 3-isopropylmalate dehydratase small subunit [Rhodospirillales bacterium]|nr:3-isopropylmalate dehydratase small subunit [Rhodospirillales bacterium]MBO6786314.1 3-isopropylmalate dehydratase small subunit [Rhodospirillales bacterium]
MSIIKGSAWAYGANIDTDALAPIGSYSGADNIEAGAVHCLRDMDPGFAKGVKEGDIFVATDNLGIGSSREAAPLFLRTLGIRCVVAKSFARIFYRNCFNIGLPALVCPNAAEIAKGDTLAIDTSTGEIVDETQGTTFRCQPIPDHLMSIVDEGGLMPYLEKKLAKSA